MNPFKQLFLLTHQLFQLVDEGVKDDNEREAFIKELEQLLEQREEVLKKIDREPTDGEKQLLKQMVEWNEKMAPKLEREMYAVNREMRNLKKKKVTSKRYDNPYDYTPLDGAFIDKKN